MKVGRYSSNTTSALFVVGNGRAEKRQNAFAVFGNGHAEVAYVSATTLSSVVNVEYLNNTIANAATVAEIRDGVLHVSRGLGVKVYRHVMQIHATQDFTEQYGTNDEYTVILYVYSSDATPITKETLLSRIPASGPAWGQSKTAKYDALWSLNTDYYIGDDSKIVLYSWTLYGITGYGFNWVMAKISLDNIDYLADVITEV